MGGSVFQQVEEFQLAALGHLLLAEVIEQQDLRPAAAGQRVLGQSFSLGVVVPLVRTRFGECRGRYAVDPKPAEMQALEQQPRRPCLAAARRADEADSDGIILPCLAFAQEGRWDAFGIALAVEWWTERIERLLPPLLLLGGLFLLELQNPFEIAVIAQHLHRREIPQKVMARYLHRVEARLARAGLHGGYHGSTSSTLAGASAGSTLLSQLMTN